MMKAGICMAVLMWCSSCLCYGQRDTWQDFLMGLTMDQEQMGTEAWQEYIASLEELHSSRMDINGATPDEMAQIPFLTPEQVEALQAYVHMDGPMKTLGELALIPELDDETRKILPFFFYVGEPARLSGSGSQKALEKLWKDYLKPSKTTLDSRLDVPLYQRRGQTDGSYAGDGLYNRLRLNVETNRLQAGFRAEKDAGERWYDSYGGYGMYQGKGIVRQVIGGDYRAGWGEGLVMSSRALSLKSTLGATPSQGLRPMRSTSEYNYLRGAALTVGSNGSGVKVQGSAFVSYRRLDATLTDEGYAKTVVTNGYHRTESEIEKKGNTPTLIIGGHAQVDWRHLVVGVTGFFQHYERPLAPGDADYRRYWLSGYNMGNVGMHASYNHYRINTAGEVAYCLGGSNGSNGSNGLSGIDRLAATGRFGYTFSRRFRATLQGRYFGKGYYSSQAATVVEGSDVRNQAGGMLSLHVVPVRWLATDTYIDVFCDLWPRYGMTHTGWGQDFVLQNELTTQKVGTWAFGYHLKRKESYDEMVTNHKLQLGNTLQAVNHEHYALRLKTTANLHLAQASPGDRYDVGYAITENVQNRLTLRRNHRLRLNLDLSWFDTPNYLSRVYLTQTTMWNGFSYLMCYGRGVSSALYLRYTMPNDRLMVEARYCVVHRLDTDTQGSGYQEIQSPTKQDVSLQLRVML